MSMYAQILDAVIEGRQRPETALTAAEALSELSRCRAHLNSINGYDRSADWTTIALASQVAHDVALIELARSVGIPCDAGAFEQPEVRRAELNRELISRGFRLGEPEEPVWIAVENY
jgi:hypothetical protein